MSESKGPAATIRQRRKAWPESDFRRTFLCKSGERDWTPASDVRYNTAILISSLRSKVTFFLLCPLLVILSGVTPRSARTLAMPLASTPQFGATFVSQRRCTFILQTAIKRQVTEHSKYHRGVHLACRNQTLFDLPITFPKKYHFSGKVPAWFAVTYPCYYDVINLVMTMENRVFTQCPDQTQEKKEVSHDPVNLQQNLDWKRSPSALGF